MDSINPTITRHPVAISIDNCAHTSLMNVYRKDYRGNITRLIASMASSSSFSAYTSPTFAEKTSQRASMAQEPEMVRFMEADDYFKRGIRHYKDGDYDGAISNYTKAIRQASTMFLLGVTEGLCGEKKGDF